VSVSFLTVIRGFGNNAAIEVPTDVLNQLGAGKRPRVIVQVGDYRFTTTVGAMAGLSLISLSKAHRDASGLRAGQDIHVELELDTAPPEIAVPADLASALAQAGVREAFDKLAPSRRKEYVRQLTEAKAEQTRERRLTKVVADVTSVASKG
jgi:hypothetical protein